MITGLQGDIWNVLRRGATTEQPEPVKAGITSTRRSQNIAIPALKGQAKFNADVTRREPSDLTVPLVVPYSSTQCKGRALGPASI